MKFACNDRSRSVVEAIVLRLSSLALMAYVMLFLLVTGGFDVLGAFSAVVAITAPVIMFLMFRYVESLSIADDKKREYSLLLWVAVGGFITVSPLLYLVSASFGVDKGFLIVLLAFKPFEIAADLSMTFFVASRMEKDAVRSALLRMSGVVLCSLLLHAGTDSSALMCVSLSLLFAYVLTFLCYDLPRLVAVKGIGLYGIGSILAFARVNAGFGVLNFAVSLNSSMPRYLLAGQAGLANLGLFSFTYQLAATLVNIFQYPVSLRARSVLAWVGHRLQGVRIFCGVAFVTLAAGAFSVAAGWVPAMSAEALDYSHLGLAALLMVLMAVVLMMRGVLLTALIAMEQRAHMYLLVIASIALATILSVPLFASNNTGMEIYGASIYVLASSLTSCVLILRQLSKGGATCSYLKLQHR